MESKVEILNRISLIMNYDSSKTLNENKKDLNIIDEQFAPIVRDVEGALGSLKGVERNALKSAFKSEVKNMVRSDGSLIKNVDELESALKNGELGPSGVRLLKNRLLRDPRIGPKVKNYLIDDLIQGQRFKRKYAKFNDTQVKDELKKYYSPAQAEEIGNRYVKSRGYSDVNPANGQPIKPTTGEVPPTGDYFGNSSSTLGNRPIEYVKPEVKVDPAGNPLNVKSDVNVSGNNNVVNINITQQTQKAERDIINNPETVKNGEKIVEDAVEVTPEAIKSETVTVSESGGKAINKPKRSVLEQGKRGVKIFLLTKAATILIMGGGMVGLAYLMFRKKNPGSDVVLLDPNGQNLPDSSVSSEVEVPPPVDPNTAASSSAVTAAPIRPSTPPEKPTNNLSLTNVLNSIDKPNPNALSQEEKNHLINSIRNGKKYVGVDLNPAQRSFVDQYMKNTNVRVPSKEKLKYSATGEPIQQKIKYGNKL